MSAPFDYESAIEACTKGDRGALRQLYDQEAPRLLGVAQRLLKNKQLAEEALQDAFVQIWTRAETFDRNRGSGRGWIYTILRHRALSELRSAQASRTVSLEASESLVDEKAPLFGADSFEEEFNGSPEELALRKCLHELGPEQAQYIQAAYIDGYTQAELAERQSVPLGTMKSLIRRGLISLRKCLAWS